MMAKNEVMDPSTGEVLPAAILKRMKDSAKKAQQFRQDDLIIPRLAILQDLSDQVRPRQSAYVEGAKAGDIFNNVTGTLDQSLVFVPSYYNVRYIAWKPRPDGGLVDMDFPEKDLDTLQKDGISKWVGEIEREGKKVYVEVIQTPEWAGIAVGNNGRAIPCVISFPSTKAKAARKINTTVELAELEDGSKPAAFCHQFELTSGLETSGDNEWFGWTVSHLGYVTDEGLLERAEKLFDGMKSGEVSAADQGHQDG